MNLDALVAPLRAEVVSGATTVARTAGDVFRRAARDAEVESGSALRDVLARLAVRVLDAQPAMAPLVHLGSRVLTAAADAEEPEDVRRAVAKAVEEFRAGLERSGERVARHAAERVPERGRLVTLSFSSSVCGAIRSARAEGRRPEVVCLESRPMSEGRALARRLADEGVRVVYAVDAAAWALAEDSDAVLLGADSVGDRGVVNKIGSLSLARAAAEHGVPVHVVAGTAKLLPPGFPQPTEDDRPEGEVWESGPGIRVWNRYFESVPTRLVDAVVVEAGALDPARLRERREEIPVPPPLAAWAGERRRGDAAPS